MYSIYFNDQEDVFALLTESEARSPLYKDYMLYASGFDTEDAAWDYLGPGEEISEESVYDFLENVVPLLQAEEKNRILDNL